MTIITKERQTLSDSTRNPTSQTGSKRSIKSSPISDAITTYKGYEVSRSKASRRLSGLSGSKSTATGATDPKLPRKTAKFTVGSESDQEV